MKKKTRISFRISSLLLVLAMFMTTLTMLPMTANAAEVTKAEKSYEIAVVFDNSGSMYDNAAWCRAKYAMEIFASMLNYEKGDKLRIFTMWEVTTDGSKPESGGSFSVEINNKDDIDKITNLYTVRPSNTPFAPVLEAHEYLKTSNATDKWIIVLTDGEFNQVERGKTTGKFVTDDLKNRLLSVATNGINVQYLGFGGATEVQSDEANRFFAKKSSDNSLKDDLIGICNSIFQRSILPSNCLSGTTLNLDLSMNNLIVFAQGRDAKIISLTDDKGNEVKITLDSGQRKHSDIKAKGHDNAPTDDTLAGQVVTFDKCPKGQYTLNYSGADADDIQLFYEPDVDIKVTLTNHDGIVVDGSSGEITAGEYTINSAIVDGTTGEDVTSHELMGNDVKLRTKVKSSQDSEYKEYENGAKITLAPDSSTDILIEGTYLKEYTITSRDNPELAWLKGIKIKEPSVDFQIDATVFQDKSWYTIKDHEKWKPVRVTMTIEGQPLTDEQMANVKLSFATSNGLKCRYEVIPGESACNVYIAQDESGKYVEPQTGKYELNITATYTDEYGKESVDADKVNFEIQKYAKILKKLFWIALFTLLFLIILIILNHPSLPSAVYLNVRRTSHTVKIIGTSIGLSTDLYPGEIRCDAKACTPFKNRGKSTAAFEIKNIKPAGSVKWYSIDGEKFKKVSAKYVNDDGLTIDQVNPKIRVSDDTELKWQTNSHTVTGRIYINHND